MNWKVWLHSILAAAIGGASTALSAALAVPKDFNFSVDGFTNLWHVALLGALVPVLLFLKQSPLPPDDSTPPPANTAGKIVSLLLIALLIPLSLPMSGCTVSSGQIAADGQAVAQASLSIAAQIAPTNPTLAAQITTAANALAAITSNWQTGSKLQVFNDATNALEVVLAAIPLTAPFAPLVSIAVAAIDVLIANASQGSAGPTPVRASASPALLAYRATAPHIKHRLLRSPEGDFKAAWNEAVKSNALQPSMALR